MTQGAGHPASDGHWRFRRTDSTILRMMRLVGVGALAGAIAGLIAGGVGSRVAMRIVALLAGRDRYGELTEAEARVGAISAEGTLFLLLFGLVLGMLGGLLYVAIRPWLPGRGAIRGLAFGCVVLAVTGSVLIRGDNFDFDRFVTPFVTVPMFAVLPIGYGVLVGAIVDRFGGTIRGQSRRASPHVIGWAVLGLATAVGLAFDVRSLSQLF